jgi:hypothetical protein
MGDLIPQGTWVEIHRTVLPEGERAPQVPEDTQRVPLEMRVKGFLVVPSCLGDKAQIRTMMGRQMQGVLSDVNPGYMHSFGPPIPELLSIGVEVRAMLRKYVQKP